MNSDLRRHRIGCNSYFSKHGIPLFFGDFNCLYSITPLLWRIQSVVNNEDWRTTTAQELGRKLEKPKRRDEVSWEHNMVFRLGRSPLVALPRTLRPDRLGRSPLSGALPPNPHASVAIKDSWWYHDITRSLRDDFLTIIARILIKSYLSCLSMIIIFYVLIVVLLAWENMDNRLMTLK